MFILSAEIVGKNKKSWTINPILKKNISLFGSPEKKFFERGFAAHLTVMRNVQRSYSRVQKFKMCDRKKKSAWSYTKYY